MRTLTQALTALLLATAVCGAVATCGKKGPLRLPEESAAVTVTAAVAGAPAVRP